METNVQQLKPLGAQGGGVRWADARRLADLLDGGFVQAPDPLRNRFEFFGFGNARPGEARGEVLKRDVGAVAGRYSNGLPLRERYLAVSQVGHEPIESVIAGAEVLRRSMRSRVPNEVVALLVEAQARFIDREVAAEGSDSAGVARGRALRGMLSGQAASADEIRDALLAAGCFDVQRKSCLAAAAAYGRGLPGPTGGELTGELFRIFSGNPLDLSAPQVELYEESVDAVRYSESLLDAIGMPLTKAGFDALDADRKQALYRDRSFDAEQLRGGYPFQRPAFLDALESALDAEVMAVRTRRSA